MIWCLPFVQRRIPSVNDNAKMCWIKFKTIFTKFFDLLQKVNCFQYWKSHAPFWIAKVQVLNEQNKLFMYSLLHILLHNELEFFFCFATNFIGFRIVIELVQTRKLFGNHVNNPFGDEIILKKINIDSATLNCHNIKVDLICRRPPTIASDHKMHSMSWQFMQVKHWNYCNSFWMVKKSADVSSVNSIHFTFERK